MRQLLQQFPEFPASVCVLPRQPLPSLMVPLGCRPSKTVVSVGGASSVEGAKGVNCSVCSLPPPTGVTQTLSFFPAAKKKTPAFNIGRFQVTPSQATPPQPRHLWQATPTAHSPPPPTPSQSESSGSSSASDGSVRTAPGFLSDRQQQGGEGLQKEGGGAPARRTSVSLWEGQASSHAASQSRSRTVSNASSDESESENEEWTELQQLRDR